MSFKSGPQVSTTSHILPTLQYQIMTVLIVLYLHLCLNIMHGLSAPLPGDIMSLYMHDGLNYAEEKRKGIDNLENGSISKREDGHPTKDEGDFPWRDLFKLLYQEVGDKNQQNPVPDSHRRHISQSKRDDNRPKYDPGWKFIGLGKRPLPREVSWFYDHLEPTGSTLGFIDPLLGVSTLINMELMHAMKDSMIPATSKDTVKKEDSIGVSDSRDSALNQRYNSKFSWFGSRQKTMYDPGWMLTGLGKK